MSIIGGRPDMENYLTIALYLKNMISPAPHHETLEISCKDLGVLLLESYCPRCFWFKIHVSSLPFQIFPGIFSSIDAYTKKVTKAYFEKYEIPPKWFRGFEGLEKPVRVPPRSEFFVLHKESGVKLTGAPDEIFQKRNGSYFIVDYKTARYTPGQKLWMPIYEVQLNGYAYIAEHVGLKPVDGLGLVYYEPMTALSPSEMKANVGKKGFGMQFVAKLHKVKLDAGMIEPLLMKARAVYDLESPPEGRAKCKDCRAIDELVSHAR